MCNAGNQSSTLYDLQVDMNIVAICRLPAAWPSETIVIKISHSLSCWWTHFETSQLVMPIHLSPRPSPRPIRKPSLITPVTSATVPSRERHTAARWLRPRVMTLSDLYPRHRVVPGQLGIEARQLGLSFNLWSNRYKQTANSSVQIMVYVIVVWYIQGIPSCSHYLRLLPAGVGPCWRSWNPRANVEWYPSLYCLMLSVSVTHIGVAGDIWFQCTSPWPCLYHVNDVKRQSTLLVSRTTRLDTILDGDWLTSNN